MPTWEKLEGFEDIIYEKRDDGVARVTVNRPEVRNALRRQTYEEMTRAFMDAGDDERLGVVVLTGAGDKAFSSGGDVRTQRTRTRSEGRRHMRHIMMLGHAMRTCYKPIIAAVRGYAVGGGHELHLMCDLTIAADNAQFGQVGPRVGSVPVWGATENLPLLVGDKKAREIVYLCRFYTAQEAVEMGLINKVVPLDELDEEVERWCQELLDKSPFALRVAKMSMNAATDLLFNAYYHGSELLTMFYNTEEQKEGARAFLEKRPPNYRRFRREDEEPQ